MGQTSTKDKTHDERNAGTDDDKDSKTVVESLGDNEINGLLNDHEPGNSVESSERHTKKRQKQPPEKIKSFADESKKEYVLDGSFKNLEEQQLAKDVKQQNFFLDDILEEGATAIPPPEEHLCETNDNMDADSNVKKEKKHPPPVQKRKRPGRRSRSKIAPYSDPNEDDSCVSLYSFRSSVVPNELFDIVIPPPPQFSTPDFVPQEDKDIHFNPDELDGVVFKHLLSQVLEPSELPSDDSVDEDHITAKQLFNSLSDGQKSPYLFDPSFLLLIDTRTKQEYDEGHIATAHHVSEVQRNMEQFSPASQYTMIVLYDTDGYQYSLRNSSISVAMDMLLQEDADAFVLDGGYVEFYKLFPFWCTTEVPANLKERASLILSLPSIVLDGRLYLGTVDHANKETSLRYLNISQIVCISHEIHTKFEDIEYFQIPEADEPQAKLYEYFADVINFIETAISRGGTVLVHCTLGQSRSATIVLAYLMYAKHWPLETAYRFVKDCRPVIHPNTGFIGQLLTFEKALFGREITCAQKFGHGTDIKVLNVRTTSKEQTIDLINRNVLEKFNKSSLVDASAQKETVSNTHSQVKSTSLITVRRVEPSTYAIAKIQENGSVETSDLLSRRGLNNTLNADCFEEEIALDKAKKSSNAQFDELNSNFDNHDLSSSRETLDNTIVVI